ncbi:MAG: AAA family ATPase [Actinobacteria bacterium]|nr:AAA family ATPase [Actinomycetota bacterium]
MGAAPRLLGREAEIAAIDELIARVRGGRGGALVLRGEPGVGKTALLDACAARADGTTVLRASGVESEGELAFAAVHRMCSDVLEGGIDELPDPQGAAVRAAFGLADADRPPDPFLVGLGVLNRLSFAAVARPLVCLIDDAQWLDRISAQTLAFAAHRLDADPVALVFAIREPVEAFGGLPELVVEELSTEDSLALLASRLPVPIDPRVRDRFVDEAHGNPLALLELPRAFSAAELAGGLGIEDSRSDRTAGLLDEGFGRRAEALPEDTRLLLLTAAADPTGDPTLLWRAAGSLGVDPEAAAPAEAAGLIGIGERTVFRHPAVRSAVYRSADPQTRRLVHRALAEATDPEVDPDRRAWHRARGTLGHDEEVAVELTRSAERAQGRGGMAAAAAFLSQAAMLTEDPEQRARRALASAHLNLMVGSTPEALALLSTAAHADLDDDTRTRLDLAKVRLDYAIGRDAQDALRLLAVAKRLEGIDADLAIQTYMEAFGIALIAGGLDDCVDVAAIANAAGAASSLPSSPHGDPRRLLLDGATRLVGAGDSGHLKGPLAAYRAAVASRCADGSISRDGSAARWLSIGIYSAITLFDHEAWDELSARQIEVIGTVGDLAMLGTALTSRAVMLIQVGDMDGAASTVQEIEAAAEMTGSGMPRYAAIALAARRGGEQGATDLLEAGVEAARSRGEGIGVAFLLWESAFLGNGLGRYEDALSAAQWAREHADGGPTLWLPELIEAAARSEEPEQAADALDLLSAAALAARTDWALGVEARSRALLGVGHSAECLYLEAIERLARTPARVDLARAHLLYGEWLRREGLRSRAREELRTAHEILEAIGLPAFTERAARELAATGQRVRRRAPEARDELTERESQIARLAAAGLSNRQIGEQLYISHRTVGYHLGKVFSKLAVDNRAQLHSVLGEAADPARAGSLEPE